MSTDENKALARRYLEAVNQQNFAALDELLSADYRYRVPGQPAPLNRAQHQQFVSLFYTAFPDLVHTIEDQIAEGDRVVTRATDRGTHRGELMGMPPTGKPFSVTGINIVRIAGGQIVEEWVNFDLLGLLQQLGVAPTTGQGGR